MSTNNKQIWMSRLALSLFLSAATVPAPAALLLQRPSPPPSSFVALSLETQKGVTALIKKSTVKARLNATRLRRGHEDSHVLVVYNRIPKTGSASLLAGINAAADHGLYLWHGHSYNNKYQFDQAAESRSNILKFCQHLSQLSRPGVYALHTTYLECPPSQAAVVYINQVRDPIDRFVSQRLFLQNCICNPPEHGGKWCADRRAALEPAKDRFCGMQINELAVWAVEDAGSASGSAATSGKAAGSGTASLKKILNVYTAYFCGAGVFAPPECADLNSPEALATAKSTMEHRFTWVGILEEPSMSHQVLRHHLPSFFGKGVYKDADRVAHHGDVHFANGTLARSSGRNSSALSGVVHDRVKAILANDYALYRFAKELLRKQAEHLLH